MNIESYNTQRDALGSVIYGRWTAQPHDRRDDHFIRVSCAHGVRTRKLIILVESRFALNFTEITSTTITSFDSDKVNFCVKLQLHLAHWENGFV